MNRRARLEMHGMSYSPEYMAWKSIKNRCYRTGNPQYKNYGERGITMCCLWKNSFSEFFAHVGNRPAQNMSIDRIDPDGNYEPGNVRWADRQTQARNKGDRNSVTGIRGVRILNNRYYAYIHVERRQISLGGHDDFFSACCCRKSAELKVWRYLA